MCFGKSLNTPTGDKRILFRIKDFAIGNDSGFRIEIQMQLFRPNIRMGITQMHMAFGHKLPGQFLQSRFIRRQMNRSSHDIDRPGGNVLFTHLAVFDLIRTNFNWSAFGRGGSDRRGMKR